MLVATQQPSMHIVPFITPTVFYTDQNMRAGRNQFSQSDLSRVADFSSMGPTIDMVHAGSATASLFEVNNTLDTSKQP
jgi:hypothetical protein